MTVWLYGWVRLALFSLRLVKFGLAIATLPPDTLPVLFGPVADTPHIEGVRGKGAFVLVTCMVKKPCREIS
jgi:hypothetical protein